MLNGGFSPPPGPPRPVRELRQLVRSDLECFDSLPARDDPEWDHLRTAVLYASLRWRNARAKANNVAAAVVFLCSAGGLASWIAILPLWVVDKGELQHQKALGTVALLGAFFIATAASTMVYLMARRHRASAPEALRVDVLLPACFLAVALSLSRATPRSVVLLGAFGCAAACCLWISVWFGTLLSETITNRVITRRCLPFDGLLIDAVHLAADFHCSSRWRLSAGAARLACDRLESLALASDKAMTAPGRASPRARNELRQDGLRLAAVFRAHQKKVATTHTVEDADRIVASLLVAVEAFATCDRDALLAHAPDSVPVERRLYNALVRTWPPLVMIAAGVGLPFIPLLADQPAAAGSLRWSLIVAGVLSIVAGRDTAGQVGGILDKALPWRK